MTYISGTLTNANPAAALYSLMDAALTTAGYTLIDTVVIGARTHKVWRSLAANNAANLDWYLDVSYTTTGAGSVWVSPFEYFDPATDLGYRGVPVLDTTATLETTNYTKYGNTGYALETNWVTAAPTVHQIDVSTASFAYWISITQNRVIAMTSLSPEKVVYCGFWQPNAAFSNNAGSLLYPLVVGSLGSYLSLSAAVGLANAGVTRVPRAPSISRWQRTAAFWTGHYLGNSPEGGYGVIGAGDDNPFLGPQPPRGKYVYMLLNQTIGYFTTDNVAFAGNSTVPANVGKLHDLLSFGAAATVTRGDTVTIEGEEWVLTSKLSSSYTAFAFKAL